MAGGEPGMHRPLIELCRAAHVPVIAANAPLRPVSACRKSGLAYDEYRAELDAAERQWLPAENEHLAGDYRDRFAEIIQRRTAGMTPASQPVAPPASQPSPQMTGPPTSQPVSRPASEIAAEQPVSMPPQMPSEMPSTIPADLPSIMPAAMPGTMPTGMSGTCRGGMPALPSWQDLYKAQLLWDQAIADSIADFRDRFPDRRVMLVVGGFHVARAGGTVQKFRHRRPEDKLLTVIYHDHPDGQFAFAEEDRGAGDIIIYGLTPPEPEPPSMPAAPGKPTSQPTATQPGEMRPAVTQPTESQPANVPASMPASMRASAPAETKLPASAPTQGRASRAGCGYL
jgi:hypothetical protein